MRNFLKAEWRYLVMLSYVVEQELLHRYVPNGVELDTWNGDACVSMVGFLFLRTRVMGLGMPLHTNFEEVNLRFYVRRSAPEASLECKVASLYGPEFAGPLSVPPLSAFVAEGSPVTVSTGAVL